MEITYLGHSSFKLKSKSATLVTDPYDTSVGLKFPTTVADIVTVSHDHGDHNSLSNIKDYKKVISGPGEYEIMDVSLIGVSSFHDDKKGEERGKNVVYVIEMDGIRLLHTGDLGHKLTDKMLDAIGEIDVLFIPVGGFYTIEPDIAVEVAQSIEASITIPMHYQREGLSNEIFSNLLGPESFIEKLGLPVEKTDKLTVKKDSLQLEEKIVLFQ